MKKILLTVTIMLLLISLIRVHTGGEQIRFQTILKELSTIELNYDETINTFTKTMEGVAEMQANSNIGIDWLDAAINSIINGIGTTIALILTVIPFIQDTAKSLFTIMQFLQVILGIGASP